ncbi:MAG: MBL fold metallo-hydrolase [Rhodothermales bacterium]
MLLVLGVGQDGGVPQTGSHAHPGWTDPSRAERVVSLGLVDPVSGETWMFEATPDFRHQWYALDQFAAAAATQFSADSATRTPRRAPDGIFLTHAHMGHYTGLMFLGHESMGADSVPVHAMPRMATYLSEHGPWSQLVRYGNIRLSPLVADSTIVLNERLRVTPFLVPHRPEFSEVVGYRIDGPSRSALFIPDIDSWAEWDSWGVLLEDMLASVDIAYLDATFFADGEIPGRDMSGFPHPFITTTMERLATAADTTRGKVRFIHLNHTNPALIAGSPEWQSVISAGFHIAETGETVGL